MAIIDSTYFKGRINIDFSNESVAEDLDLYIEAIEKKYLQLLLGLPLYATYLQNQNNSEWQNLINGEDSPVTVNGYLIYFEGLKNMLANFTYYHYISENQAVNTPTGDVSLTRENAIVMLNKQKLNEAWNEAVKDYQLATDYMEDASRNQYYNLIDNVQLYPINSFSI